MLDSGVAGELAPGFPRVGMIGGGQLARMSQEAALPLGIGLRVLAGGPGEAAARGGGDIRYGSHEDRAAVLEFAAGCDVITFDHEHVPPALLHDLLATGVAVRPGPAALAHAQDKLVMRQALAAIGVPCPRWSAVSTAAEVAQFAEDTGWPVVLKAIRGGYDGRGVWVVHDPADAAAVLASPPAAGPGSNWLAEEMVGFTQELAAQVARSATGEIVAYPVVRTVQTAGICTEVIAPAPGLSPDSAAAAQAIATRIAGELDVVGMLAVELFDSPGGVFVNELAMRPHNSGHWSIDGAVTSQFENHLRAVLGLPLGDPSPRNAVSVMVNVLGGTDPDLYAGTRRAQAGDPGVRVHNYGKDVRPGRKVGHVTVCGDDFREVQDRARRAAAAVAAGGGPLNSGRSPEQARRTGGD
ncbi:MAG: 5-(carboxyamino)imidazole ribonucleotide synthase [Candidatus Nanopelagicales bacterium]